MATGVNERNGARVILTPSGAQESRSIRRLPMGWVADAVVGGRGFPWAYGGQTKRKRPIYSSQRVPLFPETASLEHLAKAAGKAAADAIIASTPLAQAPQTPGGQGAAQKPQNDEAGSDPTGPSSSASSGPSSNAASGVAKAVPKAASGVAEAVPAASGVAEAFPVASGVAEAGPAASGSSQGAVAMDTSVPHSRVDDRGGPSDGQPKRPRLLLHRPSSPVTSLHPPGFAGINEVHGDALPEDESNWEEWLESVEIVLDQERDCEEDLWDMFGDKPPVISEAELKAIDQESDRTEVSRLVKMGVLRPPSKDEDIAGYPTLTTKIVRDWRERPHWLRRSRLVSREFRTWAPWTEELFAPASTLGVIHELHAGSLAKGLEIVTLDVRDAYLNVPQKTPVIMVQASLFEDGAAGEVPYVSEHLLPGFRGQRIAAAEWFQFVKGMLVDGGMEKFSKEPTLFRASDPSSDTNMILHADDGMLASTRQAPGGVAGRAEQESGGESE